MPFCPDCGSSHVRVGAKYCDECGVRLPPQGGIDPEATLLPSAAKTQTRRRPAALSADPQPAGEPTTQKSRSRKAPASEGPPAPAPSHGPAPPSAPAPPAQDPPPWARGVGWEAWSSAGPMPERVRVDGAAWVRVDEIELRNRESEDAHAWNIEGSGRVMRERESQRYPGGSALDTRGYRHEGGAVSFRLRGLTPEEPVVIVRQAWATGSEHGDVKVDGRPCGRFRESEMDVRSALRNRAMVIPASAVGREELSVQVVDTGSQRGLTWFHVWVYQPATSAAAYRAARAGVRDPAADPGRRVGVKLPSWAALRGVGRDLPAAVDVDGLTWRLVDELTFSDAASMEGHGFAVVDSQGTYVAYELGYAFPDGTLREERAVRYDHGEATWEVTGLTAGRELAMVLRTDVHRGAQAFDLSLDGAPVGRVRIDVRDPVKRGRHWEVLIPPHLVRGHTVRFRAAISDPGRGLTLIGVWFYQPS